MDCHVALMTDPWVKKLWGVIRMDERTDRPWGRSDPTRAMNLNNTAAVEETRCRQSWSKTCVEVLMT